MGNLEINKLQNQFIKDIATQCDIVKKDGKLEGKELSIFKQRTQDAISCNLLDEKDLAKELGAILNINPTCTSPKEVILSGMHVREMLQGYTSGEEQYMVTQTIKNLEETYTPDFLLGYRTTAICKENNGMVEEVYTNKPGSQEGICKQIATEYFYDEKGTVLKTLCNKLLAAVELYGNKNTSAYKTLKDIVKNKDIIKLAKSGALDKCLVEIQSSFPSELSSSDLIGMIQKRK